MMPEPDRVTWVLVDGENIDATLGNSILERKPASDERPRWNRLIEYVAAHWDQVARGAFFLNATSGIPAPFVQALRAIGFEVVLLSGATDEKVVDLAILRTLVALRSRAADVVLVSNDGDFAPDIETLARDGRRVAVAGFEEYRSAVYRQFTDVELLDLETDIRAFDVRLPRQRVIPIGEFDPATFLDRRA